MSSSKNPLVVTLVLVSLYGSAAQATMNVAGEARIRGEGSLNKDFNNKTPDSLRSVGSRFRVGFTFTPSSSVDVFFQPQFTKTWGSPEIVNTGTLTSTSTTGVTTTSALASSQGTSGSLANTGLNIRQAYLRYRPFEKLELTGGRQVLSYGDELLIGDPDWSNIGRTFDAAKLRTEVFSNGNLDLFWSKITENNSTTQGVQDTSFMGIYTNWEFNRYLKDVDLYALSKGSTFPFRNQIFTWGARLHSKIQFFDYRLEGSAQKGVSRYQFDGELGLTMGKSRLGAGYLYAHKDFDQLFPTFHKWLGRADLYGRRNIQGFKVSYSRQINSRLKGLLEYHLLSRTNLNAPLYDANGTALGTGTESGKGIAHEIDLDLHYRLNDILALMGGGSYLLPLDFEKQFRGGSAKAFRYFLQVAARF